MNFSRHELRKKLLHPDRGMTLKHRATRQTGQKCGSDTEGNPPYRRTSQDDYSVGRADYSSRAAGLGGESEMQHEGLHAYLVLVDDGVDHAPMGRFDQARLLDIQVGANAEQSVFRIVSARWFEPRAFWHRNYSMCGDCLLWKIGPGGCFIHRRVRYGTRDNRS